MCSTRLKVLWIGQILVRDGCIEMHNKVVSIPRLGTIIRMRIVQECELNEVSTGPKRQCNL